MDTYTAIVEQPAYDAAKALVLRHVCLPRVGCNYRLLADQFVNSWYLGALETSLGCPLALNSIITCVFFANGVYSSRLTYEDRLRMDMRVSEWSDKVCAGEIVEDGKGLPPGPIRDWAVRTGCLYVLKHDVDFTAFFKLKRVYVTEEAYERTKEFNSTRQSTRRTERVRRAIQRRILANWVGSNLRRQLRPKKP